MKVFYETIIKKDGYPPVEYSEVNVEFCCEDMEAAWGENAVRFGSFETEYNNDNAVNICARTCYPEGTVVKECSIRFCPFCGKPVETVETKRTELVKKKVKRQVESEIWEESK